MNNLQKPLHNLEIERGLLASLITIEDSYTHVSTIICEDDFSAERNRMLFRAVKVLFEDGFPVDPVTVHDQLERTKTLHSAGGDSYLAAVLNSGMVGLTNLIHYAERIRNLSHQRRIKGVLDSARADINDDGNAVDVKVSNIVSELLKVSEMPDDKDNQPESISNLIEGFLKNQEDLMKGIKPKSQATGFIDLDIKCPIQNTNLVVVAARPGMGKTTLGLNKLANMVSGNRILDKDGNVISEKTGVIFSLEMSKDEMFVKFISVEAGLGMDNTRIKNGQITEDEWAAIQRKVSEIGNDYPLYIDDRPRLTYQQIRASLIKLKSQGKDIGVVVIDYLQIMGGLDANNMTNSIGETTANLKALAKQFDCPIIVLSQLNRELEKRPNKRPVNSDLRSSGSIEQDADIIIFVYRDEVYNENSEYKGIAEIIIGKNRYGEIGTVRLGFEGKYSRFTNFINHDIKEGYKQYGYT